jgi:hypothetical protein
MDLTTTVERLLPTPNSRDHKGGITPKSWAATTQSTGEGGASKLPDVVKLLPHPTCQDGPNNGGPSQFKRNSLPLNALVMTLDGGDPTPPPSPDGSQSSDDQHPTPPTTSDDSTHDLSSG